MSERNTFENSEAETIHDFFVKKYILWHCTIHWIWKQLFFLLFYTFSFSFQRKFGMKECEACSEGKTTLSTGTKKERMCVEKTNDTNTNDVGNAQRENFLLFK